MANQHAPKHRNAIKGSESPTYRSWSSMRNRCKNPLNDSYGRYGALGVTVTERWNDFTVFLSDMGERPEGTSIDRIDPAGNYEPNNCRWADQKTQGQNQRSTIYITALGERLPLSDWAERFGVSKETIKRRVAAGVHPDIAVKEKPLSGRRVSKLNKAAMKG